MGSNTLLRQVVTLMVDVGRAAAALIAFAMVLVSGPVFAQVDLSGNWGSRMHEDWQERGIGPDTVDYTALPLNEDGRARALTYSTSMLSMLERQCIYYQPHYVVIGPQNIRIWPEANPITGEIIAWKISAATDRGVVTIWMDGRPHPPEEAVHSLSGFTTGAWEGSTLTARTTHFKEGYLRRNGVPSSDQTTIEWRLSRHDDVLTITAFIDDPVYLTETHVINRSWHLDPTINLTNPMANPCVPEAELPGLQGDGSVPHYLPGKNPYVNDMTRMYNIPVEAVLGGAETRYPEYRKKLKETYSAPDRCTRYCCGSGGTGAPVLDSFEGCLEGPRAVTGPAVR
jgi:hypothetical protein